MLAWADLQQQWAKNLDESKITGVLVWDLSAAFYTKCKNTLFGKKGNQKICANFASLIGEKFVKICYRNSLFIHANLVILEPLSRIISV